MANSGSLVGKVQDISIDKLYPDLEQPRRHMNDESLQQLMESIQAIGLIEPIKYRRLEDGDNTKLIILDGHRRWSAFKKLNEQGISGFNKIKAIEFKGDYELAQLVANMLREDFTAMEEAIAYSKIREQMPGTTEAQLGVVVGKHVSTISEILKLNILPKYIQDEAVKDKNWSRHVLLILAKTRKPELQQKRFEEYKTKIQQGKKVDRPRKKRASASAAKIDEFIKSIKKSAKSEKMTQQDRYDLKNQLEKLREEIAQIMMTLESQSTTHE